MMTEVGAPVRRRMSPARLKLPTSAALYRPARAAPDAVRALQSGRDIKRKGGRLMSLILSGKEFISEGPLGASALAGLSALAARRPVLINGIALSASDLAELAERARRTGVGVWVGDRGREEGRG